jgi:hypothetical protein
MTTLFTWKALSRPSTSDEGIVGVAPAHADPPGNVFDPQLLLPAHDQLRQLVDRHHLLQSEATGPAKSDVTSRRMPSRHLPT